MINLFAMSWNMHLLNHVMMDLKDILVSALLQEKGNSVYCTSADSTVEAAVADMNRRRIGSLMVMDAGYVVGILTERDVLTRVVAAELDPKTTSVRSVMTVRFQSISYDAPIEEAMHMMKEYRIRHLPVFDESRLLGVLSIGDFNSWLLKMNEIEADNLRRYMFEAYPC